MAQTIPSKAQGKKKKQKVRDSLENIALDYFFLMSFVQEKM